MGVSVKFFSIIALCMLLAGCSKVPDSRPYVLDRANRLFPEQFEFHEQMRRLKQGDPKQDAATAFATGERRLMAVDGRVTAVPAIEQHSALIAAIGKDIICGTAGAADPAIVELAETYAFKYNMEMLRLLTND